MKAKTIGNNSKLQLMGPTSDHDCSVILSCLFAHDDSADDLCSACMLQETNTTAMGPTMFDSSTIVG